MQSARERRFERLSIERERRRNAALMVDGRDPREALLAELEEMGRRLRADPNWREPTPEETEESSRKLDMWFRERGYGRGK
jgi:hypothetical protein